MVFYLRVGTPCEHLPFKPLMVSFLIFPISFSSYRLAYRSGVTTAVAAPSGGGFLQGIAAAFRVGAPHALAKGAVVQKETALHVSVSFTLPVSVSTQISALRSVLFAPETEDETAWSRVREVILNNAYILRWRVSNSIFPFDFRGKSHWSSPLRMQMPCQRYSV